MAWNQPGNNGQDRDPWGNRSGGRDQGPPDLDDVFRKLGKKLGGGKNNNDDPNNPGSSQGFKFTPRLVGLAVAAAVLVWGVSGFYTIKEAERGVVTRLGKYDRIVQPGLNWKPTFIESVTPVNVEAVRELPASGFMLTQDENVVRVEMNVQYKVADPAKYLFSVSNPDDSLRQATDSALRYVVGHTKMDEVLTRGRAKVRQDTWVLLDQIIAPYNMGLQVLDVNFQSARPPEEVKEAFDDAIAAQEDEQRFIREAEAYAREVEPKARGNVKRVEEEAQAYKERVILVAKGDADRFNALLPEYQAAPKVTRERMYLDTMEKVLSNSNKVLVDTNANNVLMLPTDSLMKKDGAQSAADAAAAAVSVPSLNEIGRNSGTYNSTEGQGQDSRTNVNSQDRQGRF